MTLKTKREIVRRFKAGETLYDLAKGLSTEGYRFLVDYGTENTVEPIIRDYLNGKFTLEPKRRGK